MGKIELYDLILTPRYYVMYEYKGPNVQKAPGTIQSLTKKIFGIASKDWYEPKSKFEAGDTSSFFIQWVGSFKPALKRGDKFTKAKIELIIQGSFQKDGSGQFKMKMTPAMFTKFDYSNFFQRMLYEIYNQMFYYEQRRKYKEYIKMKFEELINELKSVFGENLSEVEE